MNLKNLSLLLIFCAAFKITAQGTWTTLATLAPGQNGGVSILLSDGTIMVKSESGGGDGIGNTWHKLTPNASGSYVNGTWSTLAPMASTRLYFSSQVLKDGKVYAIGGEYGTGYGNIAGQVYNPITNTWSLTPLAGATVSDANSEILPDGKVLQAMVSGSLKGTRIYDPITNTYSLGGTSIGIHNESAWVKLKDNSVLMVDRLSTSSERYIPSLNTWTADATVPVPLYDGFGDETGGALLLPDGRAFFIGATGKTAYYTPSGNNSPGTWSIGPSMPNNLGTPDAMMAMMSNGKIMCVGSPTPITGNVFQSPSYFYELDYTTNVYTPLNIPAGNGYTNQPSYVYNMLNLPDGKMLVSRQDTDVYFVYTPSGPPLAAGQPTINNITQNGCNNFTITGNLFNGISEGQSYGDDWQNATNYPIVRLTAGTNVYYARTSNWNSTAVQRGLLADTAQFVTPAGLPQITYSLVVIANGIASQPVPFTPYPKMNSTLTPPAICSGAAFTYTPTSAYVGAVFNWERPAVAGISNTAILVPQPLNPNEVLTNTVVSPVNVIYNYTASANNCSVSAQVTVEVDPLPTLTITGGGTFCSGATVTLTANGANTYTWSNAVINSSTIISPTVTTNYSVTATNTFGCNNTSMVTVTINPGPALSITGSSLVCHGDSISLVAGGANSYTWSTGSNSVLISITATATTTYTLYGETALGCRDSLMFTQTVEPCVGITNHTNKQSDFKVYPNPTNGVFTISLPGNAREYEIKVFDHLGRTIEFSKTESKQNATIDITGNSKGIYFVTLTNKNKQVNTLRIVLN